MIDQLALTNRLADDTRKVKDQVTRNKPPCHCGNDCTDDLNRAVMVFRDSSEHAEVNIVCEETGMRAGVILAAGVFAADAIGITADGISAVNNRRELITITAARATGELMWKVQPYDTAGMTVCWGEPETPNEFPIVANTDVDVAGEIKRIITEPAPDSPFAAMLPPVVSCQGREAERALLDLIAASAIPHTTAGGDIEQTMLFADGATTRARILYEYQGMIPGAYSVAHR